MVVRCGRHVVGRLRKQWLRTAADAVRRFALRYVSRSRQRVAGQALLVVERPSRERRADPSAPCVQGNGHGRGIPALARRPEDRVSRARVVRSDERRRGRGRAARHGSLSVRRGPLALGQRRRHGDRRPCAADELRRVADDACRAIPLGQRLDRFGLRLRSGRDRLLEPAAPDARVEHGRLCRQDGAQVPAQDFPGIRRLQRKYLYRRVQSQGYGALHRADARAVSEALRRADRYDDRGNIHRRAPSRRFVYLVRRRLGRQQQRSQYLSLDAEHAAGVRKNVRRRSGGRSAEVVFARERRAGQRREVEILRADPVAVPEKFRQAAVRLVYEA